MKMTSVISENRVGLEPEWRKSKMGFEFDFNSNRWQLDGSSAFTFNRMRELDADVALGLRNALCRYAEELSGGTTESVFGYFNWYCDQTGERKITISGLANFRASLTKENEYRLGQLKAFLISWYDWGFSGIDKDVVEYLESLTLRGMIKGKAVKGACPYSGPLTLLEQGALIDWASDAFNQEILSLTQYSFFLALIFTGRRLVQIRSLRACDLIANEKEGGYEYVLKVPRVKQKGTGFREVFNPINIVSDLYLTLRNQMLESQKFVESHLNQKLPSAVALQIPIFLQKKRVLQLNTLEELIEDLSVRPDNLHLNEAGSLAEVRTVSRKNMARSERTGDFINFASRRLRYTKGTNLSRRGIQGVALADALDHSDTQNIHVYVENTVEVAAQIDAIMSPIMAPLAQAFAGKLIASERDALRANDPHSRVKNGVANNVGNCGTHKFCASGYRACYTCFNFQPWRDGPHEEVRDEILAEREEQKVAGVSPFVIQSTDRLLLAVEQVIILCNQTKLAERGLSNE